MRRNRLQSTPICTFMRGDRIEPIAMFEHHDYVKGETYTVSDIDRGDLTLRARDASGAVKSWIRWQDCRKPDAIGWEWLKGRLSADALELLSAFQGLERLRLRQDVRLALITGVPSLKERILECAGKQEGGNPHGS
jgi:hypothetical protein